MGSLRIAIDLGAGSGRLFYGNYREFKEIYRFPNTWNFGETLAFIRTGLAMLAGHRVDSISCSSWAQDFGLLDKNGELFYEPVSYLSGRADAIPDEIASLIPADELVQLAGVRRISEISTLAQWKYSVSFPSASCQPKFMGTMYGQGSSCSARVQQQVRSSMSQSMARSVTLLGSWYMVIF